MLNCEYRRRELGISQTKLGKSVKISQALISLMERGRFLPDGAQLSKLSLALGIASDKLLEPVKLQEKYQIT